MRVKKFLKLFLIVFLVVAVQFANVEKAVAYDTVGLGQRILPVCLVYLAPGGAILNIWSNVSQIDDAYVLCYQIKTDTEDMLFIAVKQSINIEKQPEIQNVLEGSVAEISVEAIGALSYQWQFSEDGIEPFTNLSNNAIYSGVTTNTLNIVSSLALNGYNYRCIITPDSTCESVGTNEVALNVFEEIGIISESESVEVCQGSNVLFDVILEGTPVSYQWYEDQGLGGVVINDGGIYYGANTSSLTLTGVTTDISGYNYYLEITSATETITSNIKALIVNNC